MATITIPGMFLTGNHASRPAANTVGKGSLYACSTHTKVYQSDASSWTDWYTAAAAGGGITATTLGTTSMGASFDTTLKTVMKKVTMASAGYIANIWVGMKGNSTNQVFQHVGLFSDNAGTPLQVIASNDSATRSQAASTQNLGGWLADTNTRFVATPLGVWVAAGDYWLTVMGEATTGNAYQMAYSSGTGSDRTKASTDVLYDHSVGASSTGTNDYSIYCDVLR